MSLLSDSLIVPSLNKARGPWFISNVSIHP